MDIFVRGLNKHASNQKVEAFFASKLAEFGIDLFDLTRLRNRALASIAILDAENGEKFLAAYGQKKNGLVLDNRPISCTKNRLDPDEWRLRALEHEKADAKKGNLKSGASMVPGGPESQSFVGFELDCGIWQYPRGDLTFVSHCKYGKHVSLQLGKAFLVIVIQRPARLTYCLKMPYSSVLSLVSKDLPQKYGGAGAITITLDRAPRFYRVHDPPSITEISNRIERGERLPRKQNDVRDCGIDGEGEIVFGHCFVYQIVVSISTLRLFTAVMTRKPLLPPHVQWSYGHQRSDRPYPNDVSQLISDLHEYNEVHFAVKFQAQRLAQNGYLTPIMVCKLLPTLEAIEERSGYRIAVQAIQKLFGQIPYAGPEAEAYYFDQANLHDTLIENEQWSLKNRSLSPFSLIKRHPHLVLIHRVRVTPTGVYLEGPDPEPKNRILREYSGDAFDSFARITFEDEDGSSIHYDREGSLDLIHDRFKSLLQNPFEVGGQQFEFLGFSHSSLRDQTCWLSSPFMDLEGNFLSARHLIAKLGNFSHIRMPAKCAARIGQAFTDLQHSVEIPLEAVQEIVDVVSPTGRVFSDGCSPASLAIFKRIWKNDSTTKFKSTLFQIRIGGMQPFQKRPMTIKYNNANLFQVSRA